MLNKFIFILVVSVSVFGFFPGSVYAADITSDFVHVSSYTPLTTFLWQNLQNITVFDNAFATCTGNDNCVLTTRYNWPDVPSGATVKSFDIKVRGYHPRAPSNGGSLHAILKKGCVLPENASNTLTSFQTEFNSWLNMHIDSTINLTGQDLTNNNYCIQIWAGNGNNGTWYIDDIQAKVTYVAPAVTPTPTAIPTPTSTPTPTATPTPTPLPTPEPFLDLPWDYESKGLSFNEAALEMTSYFDHTFPLLSSGLNENLGFLDQLTTYENRNTGLSYSSHDGYDYAQMAGVHLGDSVLAAAPGWATYINTCGACGNMIVIDHQNGYQTRYLHMQKDGLVIDVPGESVWVDSRQPIGKVGATGNVSPSGDAGAHIHFDVFQDKNEDGNFIDNIPDGVTDPFGWQSEDPDPWENYSFFYNGEQRTGNKSYYLWKKKLDSLQEVINALGGVLNMGNLMMKFPENSVPVPVTVKLQSAPQVQTEINGKEYRSVGPALEAEAFTTTGVLYESFLSSLDLIFDFGNSVLSGIKPETLSIFSSQDGSTWVKEETAIDIVNKRATAKINHFTLFALMGERMDTLAPTTLPEFLGEQGEENYFRSDVQLSLNAEDNEGGLGVAYTLYKIEGEDWQTYTEPLLFAEEGEYTVSFYSGDTDGNIEDVKTVTFSIDKTMPQVTIDANPKMLWPPNGKMVDVTITGSSSDSNIVSTTFAVDDEYNLVEPSLTEFGQTIKLQAKKEGSDKDGRRYILSAIATDTSGNQSIASTVVLVSHDQMKQ